MKNIIEVIKNDFINFIKYRIFHMTIIVSVLFALIMGFFPQIEPLLFIYTSVFILPVITHSITLFIEKEEDTVLPISLDRNKVCPICISKILSSLILQLIPFILYLFIMYFVLNMNFSFILYSLTYLIGVIVHIVIGFAITILSKNHIYMALFYAGYIILFSFLPFISLMNFITGWISYLFIFSPGYISGVLFENIIFGYLYSDVLLIVLSVLLQLAYIALLVKFILIPYFRKKLKESNV